MLKEKIIYILILMMLSVHAMNGQSVSASASVELEKLFGRLIRNSNDSVRIRVNDSIRFIIESYVESDSIFNHRFSNLRYLGQITSPDSVIKIVTWNLVLINKPGRYYSYIIKKQTNGNRNLVYRMKTDFKTDHIRTDTTYSSESWYGALYYDIRPHTLNDTISWVLLGIDYSNPMITRKIIDILNFTPDDKIQFGMKLFTSPDIIKHREVFEYSSTATMSLRFANDGSIVFNHLVPFSPEQTDDRKYYAPHNSNDAYIPADGLWKFKLNIDARNNK